MKKFKMLVSVGFVGLCAFGEDVLQFESTNTVGWTCITSSLGEFPIGVIYGDYATTNTPIASTNLVWAGNLV